MRKRKALVVHIQKKMTQTKKQIVSNATLSKYYFFEF